MLRDMSKLWINFFIFREKNAGFESKIILKKKRAKNKGKMSIQVCSVSDQKFGFIVTKLYTMILKLRKPLL